MIRILVFLFLIFLSGTSQEISATENQKIDVVPSMSDGVIFEAPKRGVENVIKGSGNTIGKTVPDCAHLSAVADVIIEGEVKRVEVKKNNKGFTYTYVDIGVNQYVKGQGKDVLTLKLWGGCTDGMCTSMSGAPVFDLGQKGYLCLMNPKGDEYDEGRFYAPACGRGMLEKMPE
jgi:hypothetical protein